MLYNKLLNFWKKFYITFYWSTLIYGSYPLSSLNRNVHDKVYKTGKQKTEPKYVHDNLTYITDFKYKNYIQLQQLRT